MKPIHTLGTILSFATLLLLTGCGNNSETTGGYGKSPALQAPVTLPQPPAPVPTAQPAPQPALKPVEKPKTFSIAIKDFSFNPSTIYVTRGTIVTWINYGQAPHTVTGDKGGPASGQISSGKSYSYTFKEVGSFPYHCSIHPSMKATIEVTP